MASNIQDKMKNLSISTKTELNILLLGETGVGKSTFINSIVNYLQNSSFKEAQKNTLNTLIPSQFTITGKNKEYNIVKVGTGEDGNENLQSGVSATQDVKTYVFNSSDGKTIRLIDTPGMGDTRGLDQDNINCENILDYLGKLTELHAICFLFKPKSSRITVYFKYCLNQILSRLDKSAKDNIIFTFTNTRGENYSAGETYSILKTILKEIEESESGVKIPLSDDNLFYFDNEGFRFIAAVKNGIEFDESVKKNNIESWNKSRSEFLKMVSYIQKLKPHHVRNTTCVNEARRMIISLSQPMAEIAQLINDNLYALEKHQAHLQLDGQSLEELKEKLYMPVINLKEIKMSQPATVCTSSKCAEICKVDGRNKWHYKQRCHDPCYLTNVPDKIIGAPALAGCYAMNPEGMCRKCSCSFTIHQHIYYMTETVQGRELDRTVEKNISSKEQVLQNAQTIIREIEHKKGELENELSTILRCCASFAHFLQHNAIAPFSDAYQEYIEYLLVRERTLGQRADRTVIHQLEGMKDRYVQLKKSFEEALKSHQQIGRTDQLITPKLIQDNIQQLYKLKCMGQKIRNLYEMQKSAKKKEHQHTEHTENLKASLAELSSQSDKKKKEEKEEKKPQKDNTRGNNQPQYRSYQRQPSRGPEDRTPPPSYDTAYRQHYQNYPPPQAGPYGPPGHGYGPHDYRPPYGAPGHDYRPHNYPVPYPGPGYDYRPYDYRGPYGQPGYSEPQPKYDEKTQKEKIEVTIHLPPNETTKDRYQGGPPPQGPGYQGGHYGASGPGPSGYYPPGPPHDPRYPPHPHNYYPTPGPGYFGGPPRPPPPTHGGPYTPHQAQGQYHRPDNDQRRSQNYQKGPGNNFQKRGGGQFQGRGGQFQGRGGPRGGRVYKKQGNFKKRNDSNDSDSDASVASSKSFKKY